MCSIAISMENELKETKDDISKKYHIVRKGDNLWSISKEYLNDPFLWHSLWKINSYIDDPNVIFPGEAILLKEMESNVQEDIQTELIKPIEKSVEPVKKETEKETKVVKATPIQAPTEAPEKKKISEAAPLALSPSIIASAGYIIQDEVPAGVILASAEGKGIFGEGDRVFIDVKDRNRLKQEGNLLTIIRTIQTIKHPITNKEIGKLVEILGELKVISYDDHFVSAIVTESFDAVEEGDELIKRKEINVPHILPKDKVELYKDKTGYIVASKSSRSISSNGDIVYLDIGEQDQLAVGDSLIIFRELAPKEDSLLLELEIDDHSLPFSIIGEISILSIKAHTATAIITKSNAEILIGDKVRYKNLIN